KYKYTRIESRRWQGEEYTPLLRQQINGHSTHAAPLPKPAASATGPLFMEAVDGYLRENPRTERSTRALKSELRRFVTVIGGARPVPSQMAPTNRRRRRPRGDGQCMRVYSVKMSRTD